MKRYTLFTIAAALLSLYSCSTVNNIQPAIPTPPSTNYITVSDAGTSTFDINPQISFINQVSTGGNTILTINMQINNGSPFSLYLKAYGSDTTDQGTFTAYNVLADLDAFSQFTNDGHGGATSVYEYIVDSASVSVSSFVHGQNNQVNQVTGTFQLWLRPDNNSLAKTYKTVNGTFNSTGAAIYTQ